MTTAVTARRDRADIRALFIESAIVEFGEKGFDGASTRSIAERINAHQPQINYHFESKADLWRAAATTLFDEMTDRLDDQSGVECTPAEQFVGVVRRFVGFCADRPQLHQIMTRESAAPSERLDWLMDQFVRERFRRTRALWVELTEQGIAAPIDPDLIHHVLIGAVSLPFQHSAEFRMLVGTEARDPDVVERHAAGLVATLLPGLGR